MRIGLAAGFATMLIALAVGGCGGDEEGSGVEVVPAAGDQAQTAESSGASYEITGNAYLKLERKEAVAVAGDYVADAPECEGADPDRVAAYATTSIGNDYPLTAPIAEVLAEGCAADLQSG